MRRRVAGLVFIFLFLSACGNRGPLYLPSPEQDPKQDSKPAPRK
jgi:predicted small lipoprotein YifL